MSVLLHSIEASSLSIPFKLSFRHASAERASTEAILVVARGRDGLVGYGEGCPRNYVTGESVQTGQAFIASQTAGWLRAIHDVETLAHWVRGHGREIDANPAAWAAVELAILDLLGKAAGVPVEALLSVPELQGRFRYTAVVGDAGAAEFEAQVARYRQAGFRTFKIKLSGDASRDGAKALALRAAGLARAAVRADANNLWSGSDVAIPALAAFDFPFFAVEEPLRAGDYEGMRKVGEALDSRIIVDESLLRKDQLVTLPGGSDRWLLNLRVSKMGGLLRSLDVVEEARKLGIGVIVGAHVGETSLLTRAALVVAAAAGDALVAQEGAFGTHLLERDLAVPPLMFGAGGWLDVETSPVRSAAGLGLDVANV